MSQKRLAILKDRAHMMAKVRSFFAKKNVLEVDCPILSTGAAVDTHIDLIPAYYNQSEIKYLHSSPEYGMKRLLVEGFGDCYQLSHVFRDGECGYKHNPEFMMIEWYRIGMKFEQMIDETCDVIKLFIGDIPTQVLSYREAFQRYAGFDYLPLTQIELFQLLKKKNVPLYSGIENENIDALLNIALAELVEPHLGKEGLTVIAYYPVTQAALAKTLMKDQELVAMRFEVYFQGVELANGYHELPDSEELRLRFGQANEQRQELGKQTLPLDEYFLGALANILPDCCGVAVGFDRLMMLKHREEDISDVIPFSWDKV